MPNEALPPPLTEEQVLDYRQRALRGELDRDEALRAVLHIRATFKPRAALDKSSPKGKDLPPDELFDL